MVKMKKGRMPAGIEPKMKDEATQAAAPMIRLRMRLIIRIPVDEKCEKHKCSAVLGGTQKRWILLF